MATKLQQLLKESTTTTSSRVKRRVQTRLSAPQVGTKRVRIDLVMSEPSKKHDKLAVRLPSLPPKISIANRSLRKGVVVRSLKEPQTIDTQKYLKASTTTISSKVKPRAKTRLSSHQVCKKRARVMKEPSTKHDKPAPPECGLPSLPLKISNADRSLRKGVVVRSLEELRTKIKTCGLVAPSVGDNFDVILEEDCTRVEDEDYFQTLPRDTVLIAVRKDDTESKGLVEVDSSSTSIDSSTLKQVAAKIARNPALITLLPKDELEIVVDTDIYSLQLLLRQSTEETKFIQDACERCLQEKIAVDEANDLLDLFRRAKSKKDTK